MLMCVTLNRKRLHMHTFFSNIGDVVVFNPAVFLVSSIAC